MPDTFEKIHKEKPADVKVGKLTTRLLKPDIVKKLAEGQKKDWGEELITEQVVKGSGTEELVSEIERSADSEKITTIKAVCRKRGVYPDIDILRIAEKSNTSHDQNIYKEIECYDGETGKLKYQKTEQFILQEKDKMSVEKQTWYTPQGASIKGITRYLTTENLKDYEIEEMLIKNIRTQDRISKQTIRSVDNDAQTVMYKLNEQPIKKSQTPKGETITPESIYRKLYDEAQQAEQKIIETNIL